MADEINFFVKYGVSIKLVRCKELMNLSSDIREAFLKTDREFPENFDIQYTHKDFDQFIDLDNPVDILERKDNHLKIIKRNEANPLETSVNSSKSDIISEDEWEESSDEDADDEDGNDTDPVNDVEENSAAFSSWPAFFVIRDEWIQNLVLQRLQNRLFLKESERKSMFSSIYDYCTQYTYYPTPAQYKIMVDAILLKWPHLRKEVANSNDAKTLWKERLRTHFKNSRRRTPNIAQIADRKRKQHLEGNNDDERPPSAKRVALWGVPNFLPCMPEGETEDTAKAHINRIIREMRVAPKNRDYTLINRLMDLTFSHRRKVIVTDLEKISDIVRIYPLLLEEDQIFHEFKRLAEFDIMTRLEFGLKKFREKLIHLKPSAQKDNLDLLRSEVGRSRNEAERLYLMNCLALLTIPYALREKPHDFFWDVAESRQPRIKVEMPDGSDGNLFCRVNNVDCYKILIEDIVVAQANDFVRAFGLLIAVHYVFNLVYNAKVSATFEAVQKFLLELPDNGKPRNKILTFLSKLKTM